MGRTFSQNFNEALSANDQKFAEYIAGMGRYSDFCQQAEAEQAQIAPSGPQREQHLGEITRPNGTTQSEKLDVKLRPRPPEPLEYAIPNNTGIASHLYGTSHNPATANSADRLLGNGLSIAPDKCIPCLPPAEAAQIYPESAVHDPAQLRASQLMRMYVSLHEVGHYHFKSGIYSYGHKTSGNDFINIHDQEQNERYSDLFSLAIMIRELGPEGVRFAKQMLSGFRDTVQGSGEAYDNGTAIALLIQRYEKDPEGFKATSPENLPAIAFDILKESTPSRNQDNILRTELGKVGLSWGNADEAHPYERAQQRLHWYQEQLDKKAAGAQVNQAALDIYQKYMAPGDQAMLSPQQMQSNLQQMAPTTQNRGIDLSAPSASDNIHMGALERAKAAFETEAPDPVSQAKPAPVSYTAQSSRIFMRH